MVLPIGALVNAGAVVAGALLGMTVGRFIPEKLRVSLFQTLGLCTMVIGLSMATQAGNVMLVILSCVLGVVTGELMRLSDRFDALGGVLKSLIRSQNSAFTDGLVSAAVLFCVGAMAMVGALEEGLGGARDTLFSKSILDFCAALMLASVSGSGVLFAFIPVLLYEGGLTLLAGAAAPYLSDPVKYTLISTGGVMVLGIGVGFVSNKSLPICNLLPALGYAAVLGLLCG